MYRKPREVSVRLGYDISEGTRNLTIRIHNWEEDEVIFVQKALGRSVGACEQSIGKIFNNQSGDPFSSVNGSVENDSRLDAFARAAPEVDAGDGVAIQRVARGDNL